MWREKFVIKILFTGQNVYWFKCFWYTIIKRPISFSNFLSHQITPDFITHCIFKSYNSRNLVQGYFRSTIINKAISLQKGKELMEETPVYSSHLRRKFLLPFVIKVSNLKYFFQQNFNASYLLLLFPYLWHTCSRYVNLYPHIFSDSRDFS